MLICIGAMISMTPTITLKGALKFTMKKLIAGGELAHSIFTGPGELLLAPPSLGDITNIRLAGDEQWSVGKDAFLACTQGIIKDYKRQGIGKAMFSGEGLFVYKISGVGILWITSLGAIIRKDVGFRRVYFLLKFTNSRLSLKKARSILWITATWLLGTRSILLSVWPQVVSSQPCPPEKDWYASSLDRGRYSCRQGTL
jgi:hypothetical protein